MSINDKRDITRALFKHHNVAFDSNEFKAFWDLGYTVVAIEDSGYTLPDILGDAYDPIVNFDIPTEQLKREKAKELRRIREKGVWGFGLALNGEPLYGSFVWGFVGDDFLGSGHDNELLQMLAARPVEHEI